LGGSSPKLKSISAAVQRSFRQFSYRFMEEEPLAGDREAEEKENEKDRREKK